MPKKSKTNDKDKKKNGTTDSGTPKHSEQAANPAANPQPPVMNLNPSRAYDQKPPRSLGTTDGISRTSTDALEAAQSIPLLPGEVLAESSVLHARYTERKLARSSLRRSSQGTNPRRSPRLLSPDTSRSPRDHRSPRDYGLRGVNSLEPSKQATRIRPESQLKSLGRYSDVMSSTGSRRDANMHSIDEHSEAQLDSHYRKVDGFDTLLSIDEQNNNTVEETHSDATSGACPRKPPS
jgi:hypothetical protein